MTAEHFEESMEVLTQRKPFTPFTVELLTGQLLEIDHPRVLLSRNGKGIFMLPGGTMFFVDHESVHGIIDAPAHVVRESKKVS